MAIQKSKLNKKFRNSQQGVALLWSLLISIVLLTMVFTLVILTVKELRISSNMDESNRAYLAAEAGMERGLYYVKTQESVASPNWCVGVTDVSIGTGLSYSGSVSVTPASNCLASNPGTITIESTGKSGNNDTKRKLKTTITVTTPDNINRFDADPTIAGGYYTPSAPSFSDMGITSQSLVVQQFDLTNLSTTNIQPGAAGGFTVGLSNGDVNDTDFGVKFTRRFIPDRIYYTLAGRVNGNLITNPQTFYFNAPAGNTNTYRVKLEYTRYGTGITGYSIVRAVVLQRSISLDGAESFSCMTTTPLESVTYSNPPIISRGDDPTMVKIDNSVYDNAGYVRVGWNGPGAQPQINRWAYLDNMAFWARN